MQSSLFRKPGDSDDDESSSQSEDISSVTSSASRDSAHLSSSLPAALPDNLGPNSSVPTAAIDPSSPSPITLYSPENPLHPAIPPVQPGYQYHILFNALLESYVQSLGSQPAATDQALLNVSRLLSNHGVIPPNSENFARPEMAGVRQTYLDGIGAYVERGLQQQQSVEGEVGGHPREHGQLSMVLRENTKPAAVPNPPTLKRMMTDAPPAGRNLDKALQRSSSLSVLANAAKTSKYRPSTAPALAESPPSFFAVESQPKPAPRKINVIIKPSRYTSDFVEIGFLGRGGFGSVYHVRNRLDGAEYAIKKVALKSEMFKKIQESGAAAFDKVIREVNIMARLEHKNIVRYYASWIDGLVAEQFDAGSVAAVDVNVGTAQLGQVEISKNDSTSSDDLPNDENHVDTSEADIIFELDTDDSRVKTLDSTNGSKSLSKDVADSKDSTDCTDDNSGEDSGESVELIPRSFPPRLRLTEPDPTSQRSSNYHKNKTTVNFKLDSDSESAHTDSESDLTESALFSAGNGAMVKSKHREQEHKPTSRNIATLHIQMSLHKLGLTSYLSSAHHSDSNPKHCFCLASSLNLFSGLVDGVSYLHERNIAHRDLKPGNIFLDVYDGKRCCKCSHTKNSLVVPRIGDFGLVKSIAEGSAPSPGAAVGTEFYRPLPGVMDDDLIGRDLFALGVILLELVHRFDTRMERVHTLSTLIRTGKVPAALDDRIADVVQGCCCLGPYVKKRWDFEMVKQAIAKIERAEAQV